MEGKRHNRESSYLLVPSPNVHNNWGWVRTNMRAGGLSAGLPCEGPTTSAISCCLPKVHIGRKLEPGVELGLEPGPGMRAVPLS